VTAFTANIRQTTSQTTFALMVVTINPVTVGLPPDPTLFGRWPEQDVAGQSKMSQDPQLNEC
jgi:hypothetical protein